VKRQAWPPHDKTANKGINIDLTIQKNKLKFNLFFQRAIKDGKKQTPFW